MGQRAFTYCLDPGRPQHEAEKNEKRKRGAVQPVGTGGSCQARPVVRWQCRCQEEHLMHARGKRAANGYCGDSLGRGKKTKGMAWIGQCGAIGEIPK